MAGLDRSEAGERAFSRYVVGRERLVFTTRRHVATLAEPFATTVVSFVAAVWLMWRFEPTLGDGVLVLGLVWLAVLGRCLFYVVEWWHAWFGSTDRRLLLQTGLVIRKVAMMPLEKVTDMSYSRSVFGQILGYGQFVLESAGQDQALRTITFVPHPDETYRLLVATIFGRGQNDDGDGSGEEPAEAAEEDEPLPPSFPPMRRPPIGGGPELPTASHYVDPIRLHADPWQGAHCSGDRGADGGPSGTDRTGS